ncbi:60S ribosomal protein L18 (nucleomorph) [Cryptomonas paramecium]|uniref:60S ribosomal protein L18 n=1 Tax=Cryptomonas paramaecium TaxID=2898 RepID=F2HIE3_9CRYP|nr:60S ribosomal protein L18 [Cryptomonas paramecium]AEA39067.1 60S ribosomal protein L18 [Cryptomonas paramecium]|mmetsp:Transcript_16869/g.46131  ORF Transcript_16869/g.46131 Transcript_16869/m.46131 type:complete len:156 (+) Transcript_16869:1977-2444(+)
MVKYSSLLIKKKMHKRSLCSEKNIYFDSVLKLYEFLSRKNVSKFSFLIFKLLKSPSSKKMSVSLSRLICIAKKNTNKIIVVVGKILNDERMVTIPAIRICSLKITESAKKKVLEAGGSFITFSQLAYNNPRGNHVFLIKKSNCLKKTTKRYLKKE